VTADRSVEIVVLSLDPIIPVDEGRASPSVRRGPSRAAASGSDNDVRFDASNEHACRFRRTALYVNFTNSSEKSRNGTREPMDLRLLTARAGLVLTRPDPHVSVS